MSLRKQTPSDFLKQIIGRPVVVKLNSGVDYRGKVSGASSLLVSAREVTKYAVDQKSLGCQQVLHPLLFLP